MWKENIQFRFIWCLIYLFIYLLTYLFSNSWIKGYVPDTKIQGRMASKFPGKFQVPSSSILWTRCCKLRCNLAEIVKFCILFWKHRKNNCRRRCFNFRNTRPIFFLKFCDHWKYQSIILLQCSIPVRNMK